MDFIGWVAAGFFVLLVVLIATKTLPDEKARAERAQDKLDQRGQAALDALRKLGRDYPRR